jgi:hypothetical protein
MHPIQYVLLRFMITSAALGAARRIIVWLNRTINTQMAAGTH